MVTKKKVASKKPTITLEEHNKLMLEQSKQTSELEKRHLVNWLVTNKHNGVPFAQKFFTMRTLIRYYPELLESEVFSQWLLDNQANILHFANKALEDKLWKYEEKS